MTSLSSESPDTPRIASWAYLSIGLTAGSVIALQICIMRIFAVGNWVHFGSLVVSLALLGFGLTSAVMCAGKDWFERNWQSVAGGALLLFGPLAVAANLIAQQHPFNAIFLVSDPAQKWLLFANFLLYFLPFLAGAFFIGAVLLRSRTAFNRVYFADLAGSGLCGLSMLAAMYVFPPEDLIAAPLILWALGALFWFGGRRSGFGLGALAIAVVLAFGGHFLAPNWLGIQKLATSDYKGVAYARKFPDNRQIYRNISPFGDLELYSSSYLHFAPGLSDNAAFNLPDMPVNAYWGLYVDGEGPVGIMRKLPEAQTAYFRFLPMHYPYVLRPNADVFVVQLAGGISTEVALRSGAKSVTVAEPNPEIRDALLNHPEIADFTGNLLGDPKVHVVGYDGRLYLAQTVDRYDVIDLSLADSAGLSNPGGFAITEKYNYTEEAMRDYMNALRDGGVLSVTLWNKEDPPKSVLRLYATMVAAAKDLDHQNLANSFYAVSTYLSTTTVLYKRGGFTEDDLAKLHETSKSLSFDEIYYAGIDYDPGQTDTLLDEYHAQVFGAAPNGAPAAQNAPAATDSTPNTDTADPTLDNVTDSDSDNAAPQVLPAIEMARIAWHNLVYGGWDDIAAHYVFDVRPLTNNRPYFAAYEKLGDLPHITDRLELFQDDWGYLLLWATLGVACAASLILIVLPVLLGWRSIFSHNPGKIGTIVYFACLGLGYIMVEVGLIAKFVEALGNATISAAVLITGMLVFSGLGSFASEYFLDRSRRVMPVVFAAIGALLIGYGALLDPVLGWIGAFPYAMRLLLTFLLIAPPSFLMGFPMPTAMTTLGRLGKDHMFLWAWGINGCFSVIGAALVPIIATSLGLAAVLQISGAAYLLALPSFFAVLLPRSPARA